MNALALARLDDPLVGSKHALRRSDFLRTLASGVNSSQPANDVGEKSSSYDEHASGSLFWTQKDPIRMDGSINLYVYSDDDPINGIDPSGLDSQFVALQVARHRLRCAATSKRMPSGNRRLRPHPVVCMLVCRHEMRTSKTNARSRSHALGIHAARLGRAEMLRAAHRRSLPTRTASPTATSLPTSHRLPMSWGPACMRISYPDVVASGLVWCACAHPQPPPEVPELRLSLEGPLTSQAELHLPRWRRGTRTVARIVTMAR